MNLTDADFEQIVNEAAQEYTDTDVINRWMPPDGEYTVVLGGLANGVSSKDGGKSWWARLPGTIVAEGNPDLDKKEFTVGFYGAKSMIGLKADVAVLAGEIIPDLRQSLAVLAGAQGTVVSVAVERGVSKQGRKYTGTNITGVIASPAGVPTEEQGDSPE